MELFYSIFNPVLVIGGMGLVFGVALSFASKVFYVEEDPKIQEVLSALPGVNCGGCGFVGCNDFAIAVVEGRGATNGCTVGGDSVGVLVSEIMGVEPKPIRRSAAFVKCSGDCDKATSKYLYHGFNDCVAVQQLANNGPKDCTFGCLGNGSCERACNYDAIKIVNGIAVIDQNKCTNCGQCIITCPRRLIEIIPVDMNVRVACNSWDKGKEVRSICSVGCIGCKLCQKTCKYDAITITSELAKIDYDKCTKCGDCVKKCPTKAIVLL